MEVWCCSIRMDPEATSPAGGAPCGGGLVPAEAVQALQLSTPAGNRTVRSAKVQPLC